jgi:hypothetical protein
MDLSGCCGSCRSQWGQCYHGLTALRSPVSPHMRYSNMSTDRSTSASETAYTLLLFLMLLFNFVTLFCGHTVLVLSESYGGFPPQGAEINSV